MDSPIQETGQYILSKELKFDKKLQLSNGSNKNIKDGFKYIIANSIQPIDHKKLEDKLNALKRALKEPVSCPNNYVFASLANRIYKDEKRNSTGQYSHGEAVPGLGNWQLLTVAERSGGLIKTVLNAPVNRKTQGSTSGYFGAAYWNQYTQQVIIVHSGTKNFGGGVADLNGVLLNQHVYQIDSAITFTDKIISVLKEINKDKGSNIQLFITGHSLGGWLAPITAFSAKYLVKKGDNFVESKDFEKEGYHTSTVIFDPPGCEEMLRRIQRNLMERYVPSRIYSLDVTTYLSAPNLINACNPQVGEVYRLFVDLSGKEKDDLWSNVKDWYDININYTRFTHSIKKIKGMFDPETGEVLKDKSGQLRIKKVRDWPLLISGDETAATRNKVFWIAKWIVRVTAHSVPIVGLLTKIAEATYAAGSFANWHIEFKEELNNFFMLANKSNDFHLPNESTCLETGGRKIRYRTADYKNRRSLNVFTQLERKFLEEYNLLQKCHENLSGFVTLEKHFDSLKDDENLMSDTMKLLKRCKAESGFLSSENFQGFIHYIKRMIHFFPKITEDVSKAYEVFPSDIHNKIYQVISSLYLNTIKGSLDFGRDNFCLVNFLEDSNLKILHTVQSCTSLGATRVYKAFNIERNNYWDQKHHAFLNLDRIFYLGEEIFICFLKKINYKYLLVIECNDVLNAKLQGFLERLFETLEENHNANSKYLKVILATEKDSNLSKFISKSKYVVNNGSKCREENNEVKFNDLTPDSQKKLLERIVIFQGREIPLITLVNGSNYLNTIIDPETIIELVKNKKIEIGKALPSLGETADYYIERKLVKKVKVKKEILKDDNLTDLFAISNISTEELSRLVNGRKVRNFGEQDPDRSDPIRFITLNKEAEENDFNNLCVEYSDCTIHGLKNKNNVGLIWKRSHGKTLSGLRRYLENYGSDSSQDKQSKDNTAIKTVNVNDINLFDEKFIVVAAEPGMGKTTALTRLGTQKAGDSKWLIRINLVEYKDKLEERNFIEEGSIVAFLHDINIVSNALAKQLLSSRLNNGDNIVLLLDGFDEITSEGQKNIVNLIKNNETKFEKVLISTRLHLRNELENSLSTVAYTLEPFYEEDQKQFLKKFLQKGLDPGTDQGRLNNCINELLEFISKSIGDKERKFMGIPMQMRMVAEAFQERLEDQIRSNQFEPFPENFNMLKLYSRFLDTKYQTYFKKKGASFSKDEIALLTIGFNQVLLHLAIKELFPNMEKDFVCKIPSEEDKQVMNLVGVAQFINGRTVFTHRTFEEYFVAGFLADILSEDEESEKYKNTIEFLAKELFDSKNEVIKTFFDYRLAKEKIHVAALNRKLGDVEKILEGNTDINVTDSLGRRALHYAAQEGHKVIVNILINNGAGIKQTDKLDKTALHYAARYNDGTEVVSCLLENAKDCINAKDKNGRTSVYYAAQQGNWDIVDCILTEKGASVDDLDKEKLLFHYTYKGSLEGLQNIVGEENMDITAIRDNHNNTLLHIATQKGHLTIVEFLLENEADVGIANNSGKRPICYAAEKQHWRIVESLLRKKAKFDDLNDQTQKPSLLVHSAKYAHWDIVKLFMVDNGRDKYFRDLGSRNRIELFFNIIRCKDLDSKDLDIATFLVEKGIKVNCCDRNSKKPIHYAAENEHWNIVHVLLRKKADFNDLSKEQKFSLLVHSTKNTRWDILELFVEDIDRDSYFDRLFCSLDDQEKLHCLYYFISIGNLDLTRSFIGSLLKERKTSDVDISNDCGETFLHLAARDGKLNIVEYLLDEKGADINAIANCGLTPLHLAAGNGHLEIVKYLVTKGADIYLSDKNSKAPIDVARDEGYKPIEKFLSDWDILYKELFYAIRDGTADTVRCLLDNNNIDVDFDFKNGLRPLHIAARESKFEVLKYLIEKGANSSIKDNRGNTVLHWTSFNSQRDLLCHLLPNDDIGFIYNVIGKIQGKPGWHCVLVDKNKHEVFLAKYSTGTIDFLNYGEVLCSGWGEDPAKGMRDLYFTRQKDLLCIIKYLVDTQNADPNIKNNNGNTILHLLSGSGSLNALKYLIDEKDADVDLRNDNNSTPLHFAACRDVAKYLVRKGSKISTKNKFGNDSLHCAANSGYLDVVKYLIEIGACFDVKNYDGNVPLHFAVQGSKLDTVKYLIDVGADLTITNAEGKTPTDLATERGIVELLIQEQQKRLFSAAKQGNLDMVRTLVNQGVSVHTIDNNNYTLLHLATCNSHLELVKYLLEKGASVLARNKQDTVLHLAVISNKEEIFRLVMDKITETDGCLNHVDAQDTEGDTPLMWAAENGSVNVAQILLEHGASIEVKNNDGMTALHWTAKNGYLHVAKLLADNGANIHAIDNNGRKPIHVAALHGHRNVMKLFLSSGGRVDDTDKDGWTPLHYAACYSQSEIADFLISHGADVNAQGKNGRTALSLTMAVKKAKLEQAPNEEMNIVGPNSLDHIQLDSGYVTTFLEQMLDEGVEIPQDGLKRSYNTAKELYSGGRYKEALKAFEFVFSLQNRTKYLGPNHPDTLVTHMNIAVVLSKLGKYEDALKILTDVLDIQRRLKVSHSDILTTQHNRAEVFYKQGRYKDALLIYEEVLEKRKEILEANHPDILITRYHISRVLNNQGEHNRALEMFREIFKLQCCMLGTDHPDTLKTQHNIAFTLYRLNKYQQASSTIKEILEKSGKVLGASHPDYLTTLHVSALVLQEIGEKEEALKVLKGIVQVQEEILGFDHSDTLATRHDIAYSLYLKGENQEALKMFRQVYEKRKEVLGSDHLYTSYTYNFIRSMEAKCIIQHYGRQNKMFLDLSKFVFNFNAHAEIQSVKQGLYLPSFEERGIKINGKCTAITRCLSQALLSRSGELFLNNLQTSAAIYERIAQGKQVSKREEREVFAFSKLLDSFERKLDSSTSSLPSNLINYMDYKTLGNLSNYIARIKGNFAIHLVTSNHVIAVYRIGDNYAYFDSNSAFVSRLKSVDQVLQVVGKAVEFAGYKVEETGFFVELFNVHKANSQLSSDDKQILAKEIKTERQLLAEQDKELGLIKVNSQELSRVQLYDFGTKIDVKGSVPLLINANMNLNSKKFKDHQDKNEVSVTAKEYLVSLRNGKNMEEAVQATKVIPFMGSKREVKDAKQAHKPLLELLVKGTINSILAAVTNTC